MANPERGEVELTSGERSYTLVLSMNAICEMQKRTGKTYGELVKSLLALDLLALRDLLWMTLKKYHAKDFPSPEKVGDFIDDLPAGANDAIHALGQLFELNEQRGQPADPPPAQS